MANIPVIDATGIAVSTKATGTGTPGDPFIPAFQLIDPVTGLAATIRSAEWGEALLGIHSVHAHSRPFITHLSKDSGTSTTLAVAASANDYVIDVVSATGIVAGNFIEVKTPTTREPDSIKVVSVATNEITLAKHLDNDYPIGTTINKVTLEMNVLGTMASPVNFNYYPRAGKVMHLEYISISIRSETQPYDSDFGDLDELINGIHIRKYIGSSSSYQTLHMIRSNQAMITQGFTVNYGDRSSPADAYSTYGYFNYLAQTSGMVRLDDDGGDFFQCMVHDDLTDLAAMRIIVGGHEEI